MRYQVVSHDPDWRRSYAAEAGLIAPALTSMMVTLHHIGSTAVPNIAAKPIIDIQVSVADVRVSVNGDKATVKFRQDYKSATLNSSAGKTLVMIKSGGKWLIQQERVG